MKERLQELGFAVGGTILLIAVIGMVSLGSLAWKSTFGVKSANIDRQIYKESKSHIEGVARDLAKYQLELTKEKDTIARKAIIDMLISRYADFDVNSLDNTNLRKFLTDVREGRIQ